MKQPRTLSVFTENRVGLLHRVTSVFTRRNLNIESLTVSESEVRGIHRFTIVSSLTRDEADKLAAQLEKQVEVLKALVHDDDDVIRRDLALYKLPAASGDDPRLVRALAEGARVVERTSAFVVLEKTGTSEELSALFAALGPDEVLEFVRSGQVAMTRPMKRLSSYLAELELAREAGAIDSNQGKV